MKGLLCWMALLIGAFGYGQSMKFETQRFDFGNIEEKGGRANFAFKFSNVSSDSLKLTGVSSSCGCTIPSWSKSYIAPGDSGFITASYDPMNRPGPFTKSLKVTNSVGENYSLIITGTVRPRPRTIKDDYPVLMGNLRTRYRAFNMGRITTESEVTTSFDLYNNGTTLIEFLGVKDTLDYAGISFNPPALAPKKTGKIEVTYDPNKVELGYNSGTLTILTSDSLNPEKKYLLVATVEEFFGNLTEDQLKASPKLSFDKTVVDFGLVGKDQITTAVVEVINGGMNELNIRKLTSNCKCLTSKMDNLTVDPGKTAQLEVTFSPVGRRGRQYKTITVFSNDPSAPTQVLSVKADIR